MQPQCLDCKEILEWPAASLWVSPEGTLTNYLDTHYGHTLVPTVRCSDHHSQVMTLHQYLYYYKDTHYLKDWHFVEAFPHPPVYSIPTGRGIEEDWLNGYCTSRGLSDYKFVYLGPAGSYSPLHMDVLCSISWSANLTGRKHWVLFPPSATPGLLDTSERRLVEDVRCVDRQQFPHFDASWEQRVELVQEPGQLVIVPSGWYHQVHNLEQTLSINHNIINAHALNNLRTFASQEHQRVCQSLQDIKNILSKEEFDTQCAKVMKLSCGMDLSEIQDMLAQYGHAL
jgi:hypothetical protein